MTCPICHRPTSHVFTVHGYPVNECQACGHRLADVPASPEHVQKVYDDQYFFGGGAGYNDYTSEAEMLRAHGRRYGAIVNQHMPPGRMLDVGAAAGFILQGFQDCGWQGAGIEPNARMAALAQSAGRQVSAGTLESLPQALQGPWDLVSMIQVVAHFYDVRRAFATAASVTKPGGYWLIETWNRSSLTARFLGKNWHEYSPPSVLHWFSPKGIAQLAGQYGLRQIARGRPGKYISGAHARSLLQYKLQSGAITRPLTPLTNLIPEQMTIPYPAEDLFWMLLRKDG